MQYKTPAVGEPGSEATACIRSPGIAVDDVEPKARLDVPAPIAERAAAASAAFNTFRPVAVASVIRAAVVSRASDSLASLATTTAEPLTAGDPVNCGDASGAAPDTSPTASVTAP